MHFVANLLLAKYPQLNLNIINTGISGDTIRDLEPRWQKDCIKHKPDVLSVLIGVNDVWRQHQGWERLPEAVYLDEYESTYQRLLSQTRQQCDCQLVLMEPFTFSSDLQDQILKDLRACIKIVHKMADQFDAVLVPMQSCIDKIIKKVPPKKWSDDSVHPYVWAHAWIAQRWLEFTKL